MLKKHTHSSFWLPAIVIIAGLFIIGIVVNITVQQARAHEDWPVDSAMPEPQNLTEKGKGVDFIELEWDKTVSGEHSLDHYDIYEEPTDTTNFQDYDLGEEYTWIIRNITGLPIQLSYPEQVELLVPDSSDQGSKAF